MNKKHATLEASYEDKPQHFTYSDVQTFMFPCANTNREVRHDQFHEVVNEPDKPIGRGRYTRVDQAHKQSLIYLVTKEGHSIKEASMELGINYSTAKSIIQVHRLQGEAWYEHDEEYQPLPRGRPRKVTAEIIHSIGEKTVCLHFHVSLRLTSCTFAQIFAVK